MFSDGDGKAPAYCTGLGKAMLAFLPEHKLLHYIENTDFQKPAPNTITSKDEFRSELERVRKNGYAIDDEKMTIGLSCIAVPIFDHNAYIAYALSISGPFIHLTHRALEDIKATILTTSSELSRMMGTP